MPQISNASLCSVANISEPPLLKKVRGCVNRFILLYFSVAAHLCARVVVWSTDECLGESTVRDAGQFQHRRGPGPPVPPVWRLASRGKGRPGSSWLLQALHMSYAPHRSIAYFTTLLQNLILLRVLHLLKMQHPVKCCCKLCTSHMHVTFQMQIFTPLLQNLILCKLRILQMQQPVQSLNNKLNLNLPKKGGNWL